MKTNHNNKILLISSLTILVPVLLGGCAVPSAEASIFNADFKVADNLDIVFDNQENIINNNYYIDSKSMYNTVYEKDPIDPVNSPTPNMHDYVQALCETYITENDLDKTYETFDGSYEIIRIIRNYPYAVHGFSFSNEMLDVFFSEYYWYSPYSNDQYLIRDGFSAREKMNIDTVVQWEKAHGSPLYN